MSTVAQYLPASSQRIFSKLFGVDVEQVNLDGMVPAHGLQSNLGDAIGSQNPLTFIADFRKILLPAAFAREEDGFLLREATDMARELAIIDPVKYLAQATKYLDRSEIPALQAMVIVEALRRLAEKSATPARDNRTPQSGALQTSSTVPAASASLRPASSHGDGLSFVEERKRINYMQMREALQGQAAGQVAFDIVFDEPDAIHEEFAIPSKAITALQRLGFEQIGQEVNGTKLTKFRHKQSGLRLNMTERSEAVPVFSLGFGLMEGTFVPGTYEDFTAISAHKASVDLGGNKTQQRRITLYQLKNVSADELPERLRELEVLVASHMMVLTKLIDVRATTAIGDKIKLEASPIQHLTVHDTTPTVAKLLALNHIVLDHKQRLSKPTPVAAKNGMSAESTMETVGSSGLINCVIVGMQGLPLTALLHRLQGETESTLATTARAAANEMSKVLGRWPQLGTQFLRTSGTVDYNAAMGRLVPGHRNLICVGVGEKTYDDACAFIQNLRHQGDGSLAIAIYDGKLSSDAGLAVHRLAALNRIGFDRVVSNEWDPAEIQALMQSLVRNDTLRSLGESITESYGPFHIVWDSGRQRSDRHIQKSYVQDDAGKKVDIHLTGKELSVLERLAHTPGSAVSKKDLINYLYAGRDEAAEKIIDVFVCKMRGKIARALRKLGYDNIENKNGPIDTSWAKGYLLNPNFGQNIAKFVIRPEDNEAPKVHAEGLVP